MEKTKVIFLCDLDGIYPQEAFAVFLGQFITNARGLALYSMYAHIGQHSEASLEYLSQDEIVVADPSQYEALYKELTEQVGYDLEVIQIKEKIC